MTNVPADSKALIWRTRFLLVIAAWLTTTVLFSFPSVRGVAAYPLYVHEDQASGEAAYVMAGGAAYWERLRAASDLYHWHRIQRIILLDEHESAGHNFVRQRLETRFERAVDYLAFCGVPSNCVSSVPQDEATWFGSLSEARGVTEHYPELVSLVVVTSAPHTRRSLLCFQRSLSEGVAVQVYSASAPQYSSEISSPLWIEYVKMVVYLFAA